MEKLDLLVEKYKEWDVIPSRQNGFAVALPSDWKSESHGAEFVMYPENFTGITDQGKIIRSPAVTLTIAFFEPTSKIFKKKASKVYKEYLGNQHKFFKKYKRLWNKEYTLISGDQAMLWGYEFERGAKRFAAICCLALKNRDLFIIDGSYLISQTPKCESTVRRIVESLTLIS